jgi:glycerol uptake facilitator-like aquaporin
MHFHDFIGYVIGQFVGAIIGAFVLVWVWHGLAQSINNGMIVWDQDRRFRLPSWLKP